MRLVNRGGTGRYLYLHDYLHIQEEKCNYQVMDHTNYNFAFYPSE